MPFLRRWREGDARVDRGEENENLLHAAERSSGSWGESPNKVAVEQSRSPNQALLRRATGAETERIVHEFVTVEAEVVGAVAALVAAYRGEVAELGGWEGGGEGLEGEGTGEAGRGVGG